MKPTPEQQLAIDIRDSNVLVSAAAGSGKTSVLVKRVVERITSAKDSVDIDRLLIMTFTNAAAAEMQVRIREAIEERIGELSNDPDRDPEMLAGLEKQAVLIHNSMITTIHGFCKSVISDHFDSIGLDPNFRVADENECKLLCHDAVEECLEKAYEKADPSFLKAVECFASSKNDSGLEKLIIDIYKFVIADPDPEKYIRDCMRYYEIASFEEFKCSELSEQFMEYVKDEFIRMKEAAESALNLICTYETLIPYKACLDGYLEIITDSLGSIEQNGINAYDLIRKRLKAVSVPSFGRIMSNKLDPDSEKAKTMVTSLRNLIKDGLSGILEMMPFDLETTFENMRASKEELGALVGTVLDFFTVYGEKKREKNVIDFNDMEHMAVSVLSDPAVADVYRQQYEEIYVDEYQDSNMTQEKLVSLICRRQPGNVFQVGDVKQSIYSFRQARPDIFLGKFNQYGDEDPINRRILLNDNFRSRREVTDSVNEVFAKIMKADLGGIDYDDDSKLRFAAQYYDECTYEKERYDYTTELILGDPASLSPEEFCANVAAERINTMMADGYMIYDKEKKVMRPISYRDFTILVRSIKKFEPVFREVFEASGIPIAVTGKEGYFGTVEIQTVLAFLSAIDNPYDDIPIAALMRSPVGGFSDEEMAALSAGEGNEIPLYDRVVNKSADSGKCSAFTELLDHYRKMSYYTPVHNLIADFIDNVYSEHVRTMTKGRQRMANLEMLLVRAQDYGRTSFKGLYQFMRYIDQVKKYEMDEGEAGIESENDDVVRLMTIHGSKGLEFPVCFIVGMERKRNTTDEYGKFVQNTRSGFGVDHIDTVRRIRTTTLPKTMASVANRRDGLAEEIRILYVAMTRAREKLIMIGCDKENGFENCARTVDSCISYLDLLKSAHGNDGFSHISIKYTNENEIVKERLGKDIRTRAAGLSLLELEASAKDKTEIPSYLNDLSYEYPYRTDKDLKAKLSVSELKHRAIEEKIRSGEIVINGGGVLFNETEPDRYIPRFARSEGETATGGTFYGTAFHRIMELWEYDNMCNITPEIIADFAGRMRTLHKMDKAMTDAINPKDVSHFLNSPLALRMKDAKERGMLFREQPFVIGVDEDGETILVQGIIDAYFYEEDGITVVDYKTDRVKEAKELEERYRTQLEYYGKALAQITGKSVKSLTIWSTCLGQEIVL